MLFAKPTVASIVADLRVKVDLLRDLQATKETEAADFQKRALEASSEAIDAQRIGNKIADLIA